MNAEFDAEQVAREAVARASIRRPKQEAPPPIELNIIEPALLHGLDIPDRRWIVPEWLPVGSVTILYGDGGTGKTLLTQQLMTSTATGLPWCGIDVVRCRSFGLFCEDDEDELHRRQAAICRQMAIQLESLDDMRWVSRVGEDNLLVTFDPDRRVVLTELLEVVAREAKAFHAQLVVVDTAADTFGGNENDRSEVRQYIGHALGKLARAIDGAVLLNAHPSRSGMSASGDMDGGSTGWSNSARSRWSLARPKTEEGEAVDTDERILTRRKANYSTVGDEIKLKWQRGVLVPQSARGGLDAVADRLEVDHVFLALLTEIEGQDRRVSDSKNAGNYAPKVFAKSPQARGWKARDFELAMGRLFATSQIAMANYGRPGDARQKIVPATPPTPETGDFFEEAIGT